MIGQFKLPHFSLIFYLLASLGFISGCDKVDSEDIRTSGMFADFYVSASTNNQTRVLAGLRTGTGLFADWIILSPGDTLKASIEETSQTLLRNSGDKYETTFDVNAGGSDVFIAFERSNDVDAPNSWISVPASFNLDAPDANHVFTSGEDISISWTPAVSDKEIEILIFGSCTSNATNEQLSFRWDITIADVGIYTVPVDSVLNAQGRQVQFDTDINCPATLILERQNFGTVDPNFGQGGVISATQSRRINIIFDP